MSDLDTRLQYSGVRVCVEVGVRVCVEVGVRVCVEVGVFLHDDAERTLVEFLKK